MVPHPSIPALKILLGRGDWQEPGWLQPMRPPRVRHDWATELAHVKNLCFQSSLCFTAKFSWRYRDFPYTPCLHTCITSRVINIPHHSGSLVQLNPCGSLSSKVTACFRIHTWCYAFCSFGEMCNGMYPSLWYHTEYFHCPKNPLCSVYSSLLPQPLATTDLFTVSLVLSFPAWHVVRIK